MGGDFLHIALDVSGNGVLRVPPQSTSDPMSQLYNITLFLTSNTMNRNFTISNITGQTPPFANIMQQEPGSTVKHINFEWPDCLVGDGKEAIGETARGEYNISIHQNFRLNGEDYYSIFNLPISVSNTIEMFPGAGQLLTNPPPGPLNGNGGRVACESIENEFLGIGELVASVRNPPGQPYRDLRVLTGGQQGGGQVGGMGNQGNSGNSGNQGNGGGNTGFNDEGGNFGGSNNGNNNNGNGGGAFGNGNGAGGFNQGNGGNNGNSNGNGNGDGNIGSGPDGASGGLGTNAGVWGSAPSLGKAVGGLLLGLVMAW